MISRRARRYSTAWKRCALHSRRRHGAIHGRTGLLTHTYLLGPNGDSNGCISFKDYDTFLVPTKPAR